MTYGYDDAGRRASMTDATGTTPETPTPPRASCPSRLLRGPVSYTYNNADQRSAITLLGSRTATCTATTPPGG